MTPSPRARRGLYTHTHTEGEREHESQFEKEGFFFFLKSREHDGGCGICSRGMFLSHSDLWLGSKRWRVRASGSAAVANSHWSDSEKEEKMRKA